MPTYLLIHGAFRGGWQWDRVAASLRDAGHEVHAPDLPGAGERRDELGKSRIDLTAYLDDLEAYVRQRDLASVMLVGHSQGGFVARALTQRIADRVRALALLDAPDPANRERAVDFGPTPPGDLDPDLLVPPRPLEPAGALTEGRAAELTERLAAQPVAVALEPVVLDAPDALALPVRRVFCSQTPEGFPSWTTRRRLEDDGVEVDLIDAPHEAPLCAPDLVAAWLEDVAYHSGTAFHSVKRSMP